MMSLSGTTVSCAAIGAKAAGNKTVSGHSGSRLSGGSSSGDGNRFARELATAPLGSLTVRKWRLENGLEIITVPDPGARSVSYLTVYRVGSRDENAAAGETGLAHLFEHLMFTGTGGGKADSGFDEQIEGMGGSSNAQTYYDFTSYIDEVPPDGLDRAIGLEAERMVNLDLAAKQVTNERDVVVEERLGTVEDSVDGMLDEMVWQQAFHAHPYRWPIIGLMADIKAVTKEKALAFYRRHYAPNRALIVVAGRFDEAAALGAMATAYGALAAAPEAAVNPAAPERAPAAVVRSRIARPVAADRLVVGYPAPALGDGDRAAFDVINELLTGGPSSRLYRLLVVAREISSSVNGDVAPTRDPGLWCLWVQMTKGNDAGRAEDAIVRELTRVAREPVPAAELAGAKNRLETRFWEDLSSSRGRAEALGHFDVTTGDFRKLLERSAAYAAVSTADVARVARAYLEPGARSVVIASPAVRP